MADLPTFDPEEEARQRLSQAMAEMGARRQAAGLPSNPHQDIQFGPVDPPNKVASQRQTGGSRGVPKHPSPIIAAIKARMAQNMMQDPVMQRLDKALIWKYKGQFATPNIQYDENGNPHGQRSVNTFMPPGAPTPTMDGRELFAIDDTDLQPGDLEHFQKLLAQKYQ